MKRLMFILGALLLPLGVVLPITFSAGRAHAASSVLSAVPPISGPGAGLCYFDDTLQPYAEDGGEGGVQAQTTGTYASGYGGAYYGLLEGVTSDPGTAQEFDFCYNWQAGYWYIINAGNGLFVSTEVEYPGTQVGVLRARAGEVGPWEKYTIGCTDGLLTIKSQGNGKYVSTEINYPAPFTNELRAQASVVGPWEKYRDSDQICSTVIP